MGFILAVVLLLQPVPCPGDAVCLCESESTFFGLPKEDTTRNKWLSCIYTVPEQFNPNIRVCAVHFTEVCFLNLGEKPTMPAVHKGCFYKVGQFQFCKDRAHDSQPVSMFSYLKKMLFDYSNTNYELCRVVLVVCRFSDQIQTW